MSIDKKIDEYLSEAITRKDNDNIMKVVASDMKKLAELQAKVLKSTQVKEMKKLISKIEDALDDIEDGVYFEGKFDMVWMAGMAERLTELEDGWTAASPYNYE